MSATTAAAGAVFFAVGVVIAFVCAHTGRRVGLWLWPAAYAFVCEAAARRWWWGGDHNLWAPLLFGLIFSAIAWLEGHQSGPRG